MGPDTDEVFPPGDDDLAAVEVVLGPQHHPMQASRRTSHWSAPPHMGQLQSGACCKIWSKQWFHCCWVPDG